MKIGFGIVPVAAWFAIGLAGQAVATKLQSLVGFNTANNIALLTFLCGAVVAIKIYERHYKRSP